MELLGFSLNLVSLLGITIVTGILVDDAIVEIENIVRHMRMGKSPYRAALEAADEIGLAVIAITFTIIAVFSPVSFMGGIAGQYFKQFGLTVAFAVLFSLLVARLITPMLAAYFMRPMPEKHEGEGFVMRGLHRRSCVRTLKVALPRRWSLGLGLFAGSIGASTCCRPASCRTRTPRASSSPSSCRPARRWRTRASPPTRCVKILKTIPEVKSVFVLGGSHADRRRRGAQGHRSSSSSCRRPSASCRRRQVKSHHRRQARRACPTSASGSSTSAASASCRSRCCRTDGEELNDAVRKLEGALRQVPGFTNVVSDAALDRPELRVVPKPDVAAELGVSTEQDRGDGAHRHHRRHRRQPRQVQRRRPPGADPRAARRGRAHRHAAPAEPARHQRHRRRRAARRRGRLRVRARARPPSTATTASAAS